MSSIHEEFIRENAKKATIDGAKYVEKYAKLVEGISDDYIKTTTAILMENQVQAADRILSESTSTGSIGSGTGSLATSGQFVKYALPIIRRVFPNLIANKLVGVQPMMQAVGFIFYLRYKAEQARGQAAANTQLNLLQTKGLPGTTPYNASAPYRNFPVNPYYTKQIVDDHMLLTAGGVRAVITTDTTANFFSAGPTADGVSVADFALPLQTQAPSVTAPFRVRILEADTNLANFNKVLTTYKWDGAGLTVESGAIASVTVNSVSYNPGTRTATINMTSTAGTDVVQRQAVMSFTYNLEANADMSELSITIDKDTIEAKTRKLKTIWTPESAQDFKSYHGIDVEAELTALMSQHIAVEIDREIIADLLNMATEVTHNFDQGAATNYNYLDRHVALMQRILLESNNIMRDTLRGKANWLVTSPEIAAVLETLKEFKPYGGQPGSGLTNEQGIGARGTLLGSIDVYVDPIFPRNKILLGYKGSSVVDAGYFYAPYIPVELTPVVYDPNNFTPRRGLLTRYATKAIELGSTFYRSIKLQNSATDTDFTVLV